MRTNITNLVSSISSGAARFSRCLTCLPIAPVPGKPSRLPAAHWLPLIILVCGGLTGCGAEKMPWETVYKTEGQVLLEGKPIAGAQVYFVPTDLMYPPEIRPTATTDANGKFSVGTFSAADGAPAGEYKVSVAWHPLVDVGSGPTRGPNKLPPKYAQAETSPLVITVAERETTLTPFDLKTR